MRKYISVFTLAFAFSMIFAASAFAQTTVSITGNTSDVENDPGWFFQRDPNNLTGGKFTNQKSSIGNGSVYGGPIGANPAEKFIVEHFMVIPMAEVNSFSFDFLMAGATNANSHQQFYMTVYANFGTSNELKFYDCRYNVVASSGSTTSFKTITFDPTQAYPVTTRGGADPSPLPCPAIPANMGSGAKIRMWSASIGDTTAGDENLAGFLDNFVEKTTTGTTIFNMEMSSRDCKNDNWANLIGSDGLLYDNQGKCVSDTEKRRPN